MKSYMDCLNEITSDELFEGLLAHGLFAEKLPPIFTSKVFYEYCSNTSAPFINLKKDNNGYIYFESIRNTNVPRSYGIPNPMKYYFLCLELQKNWDEIRNVFEQNTKEDTYKISRIHIRKRLDEKALFNMRYEEGTMDEMESEEEWIQFDAVPREVECENLEKALFFMNYKNWKTDGDPLMDFSVGKKYVVKADISQCFPSIYTHAIAWALVGKDKAKTNKSKIDWYNSIDSCCQKMRNGETHGLMIGPHASNLISEILLTSVDKNLRCKGYDYVRHIDDYTCYTESQIKAEYFLRDLNLELRKFDFAINHKKTVIEKLPKLFSENWVRKLKDKPVLGKYNTVEYSTVKSYLDTAIDLMEKNEKNASILFYAIKVIGGQNLSNNARDYCVTMMCFLAIIYPYIVPIMDKYVFERFKVSKKEIENFSNILYKDSVQESNFEGVSYSIYFALKYDFTLLINFDEVIHSTNCICKLCLLLYCKRKKLKEEMKQLKEEAMRLRDDSMDENWLFIYETLSKGNLKGEWKRLKEADVSFVKKEFLI